VGSHKPPLLGLLKFVFLMSLVTGNRPRNFSLGSEYGFYESLDEQQRDLRSAGYIVPHELGAGTSSPLKLSLTSLKSDHTVIYKVEDNDSPVSCRSFASKSKLWPDTVACISVAGLRIVQDERGEDAEYLIKLSLNGHVYTDWKRYIDFEEFGDALDEYSGHGFIVQKAKRLEQTIEAWHRVKTHRPWLVKDLSVKFLREESTLLDAFLAYLLFEAPTIELLHEFMT